MDFLYIVTSNFEKTLAVVYLKNLVLDKIKTSELLIINKSKLIIPFGLSSCSVSHESVLVLLV